jgi:acyl-homoserine lactone acylase PvdQ
MPRPLVVGLALLGCASAAQAICTANASAPVACQVKVSRRLKVQITRDDYGVPHLKARTLYDAGYGMGQAQAQDRLFQMELVRKSATGNVAELFGNRSTDMQALELSRSIFGENVIPPGQSGYIRHLAPFVGDADPHMGDQAELFRTFHYKPMRLNPR